MSHLHRHRTRWFCKTLLVVAWKPSGEGQVRLAIPEGTMRSPERTARIHMWGRIWMIVFIRLVEEIKEVARRRSCSTCSTFSVYHGGLRFGNRRKTGRDDALFLARNRFSSSPCSADR